MNRPHPFFFILTAIVISALAVGAYGVAIYFGFITFAAVFATAGTAVGKISGRAAQRRIQRFNRSLPYPGDQPPSAPTAFGDWLNARAAEQGIPARGVARATQLDALGLAAPHINTRIIRSGSGAITESARQASPACTAGGPCRAVDRITVTDPAGNRVGSLCTRCTRRRAWLPFLDNGASS